MKNRLVLLRFRKQLPKSRNLSFNVLKALVMSGIHFSKSLRNESKNHYHAKNPEHQSKSRYLELINFRLLKFVGNVTLLSLACYEYLHEFRRISMSRLKCFYAKKVIGANKIEIERVESSVATLVSAYESQTHLDAVLPGMALFTM